MMSEGPRRTQSSDENYDWKDKCIIDIIIEIFYFSTEFLPWTSSIKKQLKLKLEKKISHDRYIWNAWFS